MATRKAYIEQIRRLIYNGQPSDDATISVGLVNQWLQQAIGFAAKTNYIDSIKLDGIAYVNNSFYTNYKNLTVTTDEQFIYKVVLPHSPFGIGQDEGITMLQFKDSSSKQISQTVVFLTAYQKTYFDNMRPIPNKLMAYSEGKNVYIKSTILLTQYTANATMVSGGDSTDLNSEINVPADYYPVMTDYLVKNLLLELNQPVDSTNDGLDAPRGIQ